MKLVNINNEKKEREWTIYAPIPESIAWHRLNNFKNIGLLKTQNPKLYEDWKKRGWIPFYITKKENEKNEAQKKENLKNEMKKLLMEQPKAIEIEYGEPKEPPKMKPEVEAAFAKAAPFNDLGEYFHFIKDNNLLERKNGELVFEPFEKNEREYQS